jgi:hypothetical protein
MFITTLSTSLAPPNQALLFDLDALYEVLRLGRAVDPEELGRVLGQLFGRDLAAVAQPGQRHLCLDGKTLKGKVDCVQF